MTTHVVHLLKSFLHGGTEKKLYHLIDESASANIRHTVVSFDIDKGLEEDFRKLPNTDVVALDIPNPQTRLGPIAKWSAALASHAPKLGRVDIAQAWNEIMFPMLIPLNAANRNVGGNVLCVDSSFVLKPYEENTRSYKAVTAVMKNFAKMTNTAVVTLSPEMKSGLVSHGYKESLIKVIMNGVDVGHFRPLTGAKESLEKELGIPEGSYIIGMASRHTPELHHANKDIPTFVRSAAALERKLPALFSKCHFVICGQDTDKGDLRELADSLGIGDRVHILGPRNDMVRQYSAWDISNMCSLNEPFGLVAAESLACKTPMVVTNVDLLPHIVGEAGIAVPVTAPEQRADAWVKLLSMTQDEKRSMGDYARERVCTLFDNARMSRDYVSVWNELTDRPQPPLSSSIWNTARAAVAHYTHS